MEIGSRRVNVKFHTGSQGGRTKRAAGRISFREGDMTKVLRGCTPGIRGQQGD